METIAASLGMSFSNLWKTLTKNCGDKLYQVFVSKNLNINETVPTPIPRLLDDDVIAAIEKRTKLNRKYIRGVGTKNYVLSHLVYCSDCGYTLTGSTNHGKPEYMHPTKQRRLIKPCIHSGKRIPAEALENAVLVKLIQTFGDAELMEQAIERATPNQERIAALREEKDQLERDLKSLSTKESKFMDLYADGRFSKDLLKSKLDAVQKEREPKESRLTIVNSELENLPDPDTVAELSEWALHVLDDAATHFAIKNLAKKSFAWKRNLAERAFAGFDAEGKPLGVYVHDVSKRGKWKFDIRGIVESALEGLPKKNGKELIDPFDIDPESQGVDNIDDSDRIARKPKKKSSRTNFPKSIRGRLRPGPW